MDKQIRLFSTAKNTKKCEKGGYPMPFHSNADLPKGVRNHLPQHAQTIWRKAYNNAYERYDGEETRSAKIAWAAVKKDYEKTNSGQWKRKVEG